MDCSPPGSSVHWILQGRILEWVAIPFSRGSSQTRDGTQVSHIAGRFFTIWATREAQFYQLKQSNSLLLHKNFPFPSETPTHDPVSPISAKWTLQCSVSCRSLLLVDWFSYLRNVNFFFFFHFTCDNLHVSMPFSHIILPSPCPTESKRLFYTSAIFELDSSSSYSWP